jgi:hypothetical protein
MATANIGTVAPRIAQNPACSRSIENASRLKGTAEFSAASRNNAGALRRRSGRTGARSSQGRKNSAAPPSRSITNGSGPKPGAAMRMNM